MADETSPHAPRPSALNGAAHSIAVALGTHAETGAKLVVIHVANPAVALFAELSLDDARGIADQIKHTIATALGLEVPALPSLVGPSGAPLN